MSFLSNSNNIISTILLILPFIFPPFSFSFSISTILNIVSLLFSILIGFFIAAATTDYLRLQSLISELDANLIHIFRLGKLIQPSAAEKLANAIDEYIVAILDFSLLDWVPHTKKEFEKIIETIDEISPSNETGLFPHLKIAEADLSKKNQEIFLATKKIVSGKHWLILILLAILIGIMLLSLRNGQWLFSLISAIILFVIYQVLILLNDIDSNAFLAKKLSYQNPQEIFRAIGKLQYYPEIAIKNRWAKEPNKNYRIGIYKDYPRSLDKEIKIVQKN